MVKRVQAVESADVSLSFLKGVKQKSETIDGSFEFELLRACSPPVHAVEFYSTILAHGTPLDRGRSEVRQPGNDHGNDEQLDQPKRRKPRHTSHPTEETGDGGDWVGVCYIMQSM